MQNQNTLNYGNPTAFSSDRDHLQISGVGRVDTGLLVVTLCLVGIGMVMVYSAGHVKSSNQYGISYHYLRIQTIACIIGLVGMGIASYIPYRLYEKYSNLLLFLAFVLLILVFTPIGLGMPGTDGGVFRRWIAIKSIRFQPVEFAKIALLIHTAHFLARKPERIKSFFHGVLPNILIIGLMFGLVVKQPDFGSAVLLAVTAGCLLFIGGIRLSHTFILVAAGISLLAGFIISSPYRLKRLTEYWASIQSLEAASYQLERSLDALQWGGLFGVGIVESFAKINYLPEPHTDFIFSILGEEFGFIGAASVTIIFMIFVWRGISIARRTENRFGALFATGLTLIIGLQAFINIGVVTGVLPTKGITLPFLSYGGSSLVISLVSVGIILNISRSATRTLPKARKNEPK